MCQIAVKWCSPSSMGTSDPLDKKQQHSSKVDIMEVVWLHCHFLSASGPSRLLQRKRKSNTRLLGTGQYNIVSMHFLNHFYEMDYLLAQLF